MTRHRIAIAVGVAVLCAGLGSTHAAMADTAPSSDAPVDIRSTKDRYWACLAVDHVEVGTCIENPLPDLSGYDSLPEIIARILG
jgi:hypothetical protein